MMVVLLVVLLAANGAGRKQRADWTADQTVDEGMPASWSPGKRAEIARATEAELHERRKRLERGLPALPLFPTHTTSCNGRPCRPGEGNLKGYKMWSQPYEHREAYVQSRRRKRPHDPDPTTTYSQLVKTASQVQKDGLVVVTAGDWDYREIIINWLLHAHRLGYSNSIVLAMDVELHADLVRRRIPVFDNSALLDEWNATCLQRHIQAVRMERHLGLAAIVSAGISVLHAEASVVFLHDVMPFIRAQPADVDLLFQRDDWPSGPVHSMGTAVNPGFMYLHAVKRDSIVHFILDAIKRGLIEFYLR